MGFRGNNGNSFSFYWVYDYQRVFVFGLIMNKYILGVLLFVGMTSGASANTYECKVDGRGIMVCYPKPRGF